MQLSVSVQNLFCCRCIHFHEPLHLRLCRYSIIVYLIQIHFFLLFKNWYNFTICIANSKLLFLIAFSFFFTINHYFFYGKKFSSVPRFLRVLASNSFRTFLATAPPFLLETAFCCNPSAFSVSAICLIDNSASAVKK